MFKTLLWEDWAGIALGAWMFASPWTLGFSDHSAATMNAFVMGTILMLEEVLEAGAREVVEEWIDVVSGIWLMASPLVLGFTTYPVAAANAFVVGALTVLFAGWAMLPRTATKQHWWETVLPGF